MLLIAPFTALWLCWSAYAAPQSSTPSSPSTSVVVDSTTGVSYHGNVSFGVESFYNIRFGEDTSGKNRFTSPKPFSYPPGTSVNASVIGVACPQANSTNIFSPPILAMSEDCLTLRVDRLQGTTGPSKPLLPVMVWIYGGGFTSGQIYYPNYNPTGLLQSAAANKSPVIFAAVNYRVSVWGFASSPAIAANNSLNAGLLDQRLGLEWIKNNIHLFGGDPNNVTIFGESAGAMSIGDQIVAYGGSKPVPFHRAIMISGMSSSISGVVGNISTVHTDGLAKLLKCDTANSTIELDCLQAVPLDQLIPVVTEYEYMLSPTGLLSWQPISPSPFLPEAPSKLVRSGKFAKNVDIISGWNENDGSLFVPNNITSEAEVLAVVAAQATFDTATKNQILSLYPLSDYSAETDGNVSVTAQFFRAIEIFRDTTFTCPSLVMSNAMTNYSRPGTSSYLFVLNATIYSGLFATLNESYLGVIHGSDIAYEFDSIPAYASTLNPSPADYTLGTQMASSYANFASSGNVTGGVSTVSDWPVAHTKGSKGYKVKILGGPNNGVVELIDGLSKGPLAPEKLFDKCAFWNSQKVLDQLHE